MQSWFLASLLQSSLSHDPSEILQICRFAAKGTFIFIIINVENSCAALFFSEMFDEQSSREILSFLINWMHPFLNKTNKNGNILI